MNIRKKLLASLMLLIVAPWSVSYAQTYDVMNLPAVESKLASKSMIYSISNYHGRFFATGHFGHILYSDDGGESWIQAKVPVRSSILDIHFPTAEQGWAVGHEGIILHSSDGGETWVKQYDGLRFGTEGLAYYEELAASDPENDTFYYLVEEMHFAISQGADKPFFKVLFLDDKQGYAAGAYGMSMVTFDGGETWEHNMHRFENESYYHMFDFAPLPKTGQFFLSGEAGLFLVGDVVARKATQVHSVPWEGSFFTSSDTADGAIVMGGLRGRMFRTSDQGDTWTVVEKPPTSSIVDSTLLADGRQIFVGIAGEILVSGDDGNSFSRVPVTAGGRIYAVEAGPDDTVLVGGPSGIKKLSLPQ
ncbi:MAG: YCF48-related protein [Halioglobus sp.]